MYALSHAVNVPPEHIAAGLVTDALPVSPATPDWGAYHNELFSVSSGPVEPERAFVSVFYRGYWFWIEDSDLSAKTTFNLIDYLIRLKSFAGQPSPVLALGLG